MSTTIALLLGLLAATASPVARVYVISPDPATSAMVVAPMVTAAPFEHIGSVPRGAVVWIAAECDAVGDEMARALVQWMKAGGVVVVEDAARLASTGPLAAAAKITGLKAVSTASVGARVVHSGHPATVGVPLGKWRLRAAHGAPAVAAGARVIVQSAAGWPLVWTAKVGKGKIVCIAADRRDSRPMDIVGYDALLAQMLLAVSGAPASQLAEAAARGAFRTWIYLTFPAGQALYRLRVPVPQAYGEGRQAALRAIEIARAHPVEALQLARTAVAKAEEVAEWAERYWHKVPVEATRKAAERREILLSPGTLDFVHSMNLSTGPSGPGFGRPSSGRELWPWDLADAATAAATCYWRGLKPMLSLSPELPISLNPALEQVDADGRPLPAPRWLSRQVQRLAQRTVPELAPGTVVLYCEGQPWAAASCEPGGDYSPEAVVQYRKLAEQDGLSVAKPPTKWEASKAWLLWQKTRAACGRARWRAMAEAVHRRAAGALLVVDAGFAADPSKAGPCPETGFEQVDGAAPVILANYRAGFDPADVVAQVRWVVGLMDGDGDGQADRWPGALARFRWADTLSIPPAGHELVAAVALAAGARGILQTWASSELWPDAALACPEEVYLRWAASFEPAIALHRYWMQAAALCDAVVWRSWTSAAMARAGDEAEAQAAWAAEMWGSLAARMGFMPRFVGDGAIEAGRFDGARLVIVPSVLCASRRAAAALEKFARAGGTVVMGPGSLCFDEIHRPAGARGLLGGQRPKVKGPEDRAVGLSRRPGSARAPRLDFGRLHSDVWVPAKGQVILRDSSGGPAAWRLKVGRGNVIYLARQARADGRWAAWLAKVLQGCGCRPVAQASEGARCLASRLPGGRYLVAVYNAGAVGQQQAVRDVEVSVEMAGARRVVQLLPQEPVCYNAVVEKPVRAVANKNALKFRTTLGPHQCQFFLVQR